MPIEVSTVDDLIFLGVMAGIFGSVGVITALIVHLVLGRSE